MAEDPRDWNLETKLVRGGMARTPYGEISEALFLTQSFAYDSAAAADMPEAVARQRSAPSSRASRSSNICVVGLPKRW